MPERPRIRITKLDAARRQLETAVRLYFAEEDPVSIHALMSAAYQLLWDLNTKAGGSPMLKDQAPNWVRPDAKDAARRKLSAAANFFKHADRDHDGVLEFSDGPTELLLYDAVWKYRELTGDYIPVLGAYEIWFGLGTGGDLVSEKDAERKRIVARARELLPLASREEFLKHALPLTTEIAALKQSVRS